MSPALNARLAAHSSICSPELIFFEQMSFGLDLHLIIEIFVDVCYIQIIVLLCHSDINLLINILININACLQLLHIHFKHYKNIEDDLWGFSY